MDDRIDGAPLDCGYCRTPGADVCVEETSPAPGPEEPMYAHLACAEKRGVRPLYYIIVAQAGGQAS